MASKQYFVLKYNSGQDMMIVFYNVTYFIIITYMYMCVCWYPDACLTCCLRGGQRSAFRSRVLFFHVFRLVVVCLYQVNHLAGP